MKARLSFALVICVLLATLSFPIAAEQPPMLQATQLDTCEPGQSVTISLSLPDTEIAGGFINVQYDASLLIPVEINLCLQEQTLHMSWADLGGSINVLLDSTQNVKIENAFLHITFATHEEIAPDTYPITCTVPNAASFYALNQDGSTLPLDVQGCTASLHVSAPALPPCPARYLACQETAVCDSSVTVRICALLEQDATLSRGTYGFLCTVTDQDGTRELTLGGSEITDRIEGGGILYTAEELGGNIYTSSLSVSAQGSLRITVTPYVRLDGQILYGGSYVLVYENGIYIQTVS